MNAKNPTETVFVVCSVDLLLQGLNCTQKVTNTEIRMFTSKKFNTSSDEEEVGII